MIARVLDMPDDAAAIATWLDEQLVRGDLHEVVAELAAVHDPAGDTRPTHEPTPADAAAWLGGLLPDVLTRGTVALPADRLSALLKTPWLLPALQELVFIDGGDYWHSLASTANPLPRATADETLRRVAGAGARVGGPTSGQARPVLPTASAPRALSSRLAIVLATLAAGLLVAVASWSFLRPGAVPGGAWGWNRSDVFAAAAPDAYLDRLAGAAGEWSGADLDSEAALAARLRDLLAGCDRLIAAPHASLDDADRDWLVERCRAWRETIAGHADALAASHDVAAVRAAANATVEKLSAALRTRATDIRKRSGAA
jgi:hypothetical protein